MASDIILNDNNRAEILASNLRVKNSENEKYFFEVSTRGNGINALNFGDRDSGASYIEVEDKRGRVLLRGSGISAPHLRSRESSILKGRFGEVVVSTLEDEGRAPGKIELIGQDGSASIVLDGNSGDISLQGINSLIDKIASLEREIELLKRRQ